MSFKEMFNSQKSIHVTNMVPLEFCQFFTHVLMRQQFLEAIKGDEQIPNAKAILSHEVMFETLQERLWPMMEQLIGEELLPTYAYARLYSNADELKSHTDRPACEISITIQLGRSHHYAWPIYMGNTRYDMAEGDGVIYQGCDVPHWRNKCDGPDGYYSGQVFLHYVRKNGKYIDEAGDAKQRVAPNYMKNRTLIMENK
jgi:hypothetical protein